MAKSNLEENTLGLKALRQCRRGWESTCLVIAITEPDYEFPTTQKEDFLDEAFSFIQHELGPSVDPRKVNSISGYIELIDYWLIFTNVISKSRALRKEAESEGPDAISKSKDLREEPDCTIFVREAHKLARKISDIPLDEPRGLLNSHQATLELEKIRKVFTSLGEFPEKEPSDKCPIEIKTISDPIIIFGKIHPRLGTRHFPVLKALIEAYPDGLDLYGLREKSGKKDANKILKELQGMNEDYKRAISMPGGAWKMYTLVSNT